MTRFRYLVGFLRTLVGLPERRTLAELRARMRAQDEALRREAHGHNVPVRETATEMARWLDTKSMPLADLKRAATEIARTAGPRNAQPWCGDLSGVLRPR